MSKKGSAEVGQRLRDRRDQLNLTQESLALKLGISETFYASVEQGKSDFSKALLVRMVNVLGVSADFILFGTLDANVAGGILEAINTIPDHKRQYAYRIIKELLEALMIE